MFYNGDLQSGIALALRDSKYVACFVRGDDGESSLWESDYLKDPQVEIALATKAVALRLYAGSQEAGYLAAYYPTPVVPALIVIHKGQLLLDLRAGIAKSQFKADLLKTMINTSSLTSPTTSPRATITQATADVSSDQATVPSPNTNSLLSTALSTSEAATNPSAQSTSTDSGPAVSPPTSIRSNPSDSSSSQARSTPQSLAPLSSSSGNQPSQAVQNLLAERRRRLEVDKKEKEAAEKAGKKAKAEARQAAMTIDPNSAKAKQATYAAQQRKREQEAKLERERILRQIELDKAERKEKEERRKALAKAKAEAEDDSAFVDEQLSNEMRGPRPTRSRECAVQVRMLDGSNIRSKFPSEATLRTDVRTWLDQERLDGEVPYTFRQILTPLPNRTLSISDEEESLQTLGLTPSATLVMVPVQGYTTAYRQQGIVSQGASVGYSVVSAGAGMIKGALGSLLGHGQATARADESAAPAGSMVADSEADARAPASSLNIRTLQDQRERRDDQQFYNGNQLNFEPRRDADDKKD